MEQLVLVPVSEYNKKLISQSVTRQGSPKYQLSKVCTYQNDALKKKINKKFFSKADALVDTTLLCPRIKISNSEKLILDVVKIRIFPLEFAQQLHRKVADVPDLYFTFLDAAGTFPTLILNQNAETK